jgi:short-subunit dehydrogenase
MVNQTVLITGASSGIGKAIAKHLANNGYQVLGTSRTPEKVTIPKLEILRMDVTEIESINSALEKAGNIDILIDNAGIGIAGAIEDSSEEDIKELFDVNLFGADRLCREVIPIMRKQENRSYIINIGSLAGEFALPFQAYYSASKFALKAYTLALRSELRPYNIIPVLIEPGDFNTPFTDNRKIAENAKNSVYSSRFIKALKAQIKAERKGADPVKIAGLVYKIINKANPNPIYYVGPSSFMARLKKWLPIPDRLIQKGIELVYNI